MEEMEKIEWSAPEYEDKERSRDWFWAFGIIVVTTSVTSIIYGNYFFAVLLILGGVMLGFFAIKKPDTIYYELDEKGLRMMNRLYPYESIKSFYVRDEEKSILLIRSERFFMPIVSIPIEKNLVSIIRNKMLSNNITEGEIKEHPSEKIMEFLGF